MGKKWDLMCIHCDSGVVDDASHKLLEYDACEQMRQTMTGVLGRKNMVGTL